MLFEIHKEGKIAYKRLSDADIKRSLSSHQTHIGLSNDSLTFMADNKTEYSAMLIYKGFCDILSCEIAKIHRADGRYDAPKISMGRNADNVVNKIRSFAKESTNKKFYLLWFGLDSLTPVFWLLEEGSYDYNALNKYCNFDHMKDRYIAILKRENMFFTSVLKYIQDRMENVTINLQKDLELSVEIENGNPKFKDADVKKAQKLIHEIGQQGESLIDEYLQRKKSEKIVLNYEWMNKSAEQGKPYDFYIEYSNGLEQWIDVKTTEHEFEQAVIVSKNEIKFITEKEAEKYAIFRVYSLQNLQAKLKVCSECLKYIKKLYRDIDYMTQSMSDYRASIVNYKIAFEPGPISFNSISDEIYISSEPENNTCSNIIKLYDEYHEGCIPVYTLQAACGYFEEGEVPEMEGWVDASGHGFTTDPKRYFVVHAKGDSMLPKIKDGDLCVFEWYRAGSRNGEIVLTQSSEFDSDYGGKYTIKKYLSKKNVTDDGWQHTKVELLPLNTDYSPIELNEDGNYRVIGMLKCVL